MRIQWHIVWVIAATTMGTAGADWRDEWALEPGYAIEQVAEGFSFPTAIAFVPEPGEGPDAPLYYVTEIRGAIKVVTRDGSVRTFAEGFFELKPKKELPDNLGEVGMAGICLDAERGIVFVSYVFEDEHGLYRNGIHRFDTGKPGTFALKPTEARSIAPVLATEPTAISHMIGPMSIRDGLLYVSVGDAEIVQDSRNLDSTRGKILRMTLEGAPAPGNPYAPTDEPLDSAKPRHYVWASGLRNPFSMCWAGDHLLVAENGPGVDRLVEVHPGDDFLYDGTNGSSMTHALYVWQRAVSPVQMVWDEKGSRLIVACSGSPMQPPGELDFGIRTVQSIGFDAAAGRLTDTPRQIMRYIGDNVQLPVGVALQDDDIYVVPLMPDVDGRTVILRMRPDAQSAHPHVIRPSLTGPQLLNRYACIACHKVSDAPGYGEVGPMIDRNTLADTLEARLSSPEYLAELDKVDKMTVEPQASYRAARDELRAAAPSERVRIWLKYRLLEPRFDRAQSLMPTLGLSEEEAEQLTEFLIAPSNQFGASATAKIGALLPEPTRRNLVLMFGVGGVLGAVFGVAGWVILAWGVRRWRG